MPSATDSANVVCLDEGDPELRRAWSTFPDPVMEHDGEEWQYMGTRQSDSGWKHAFRHRCHPATNGRMNAEVGASTNWQPAGESPLEQAQRHVREGAERIAKQEALIEKLAQDGHDDMLPAARELLAQLKSIQASGVEHVAREQASPQNN